MQGLHQLKIHEPHIAMAGGEIDTGNSINKMWAYHFSLPLLPSIPFTDLVTSYLREKFSLLGYVKKIYIICFEMIASSWKWWKELKSQHLYCLAEPLEGTIFSLLNHRKENPAHKHWHCLMNQAFELCWNEFIFSKSMFASRRWIGTNYTSIASQHLLLYK